MAALDHIMPAVSKGSTWKPSYSKMSQTVTEAGMQDGMVFLINDPDALD